MNLSRSWGRAMIAAAALGGCTFPSTISAAPIPVTSYTVNSSGVTFVMSPGSMRIDVCSDRIIRVRYSSQGTIPVDNNMNFLVTRTWTPPAFTYAETSADVTITTANIRVRVTKTTGALTFLELGGATILQETTNGGKSLTPYIEQSFDSPSDEAIYGLGSMHDGIINYRGMPQYFYQANTHIAVPMILSNKGYGVLWANASRTYFNLPGQQITGGQFTTTTAGDYVFLGVDGNHQSDVTITVNGAVLNTLSNTWHSGSISGRTTLLASQTVPATLSSGTLYGGLMQNSTKFSSRGGQIVDYYFFYGPNPDDVIAGFRTATGAAPLFSKGTYGFVQCRERYSSQAEILDNAYQFRTRTIPVDVIVQDWNYWGSYGWGAMQFDPAAYPNPTQMIDSLHRMNYKYMISVWSNPQGTSNQVRNALVAQNQIIPSTNFFDAYNPTGRSIYWQYMNNAFFSIGTDAFWEDANEPENTNLEGTTVNFGSGAVTGRTYANAYGLHVCKAVADGWRSASSAKRVCILTRSGFPGSQRFGTINWNGDIGGNWNWYQRSIPAGLNFCMAGIPYWTTDIGGFFRPSNQYTDAGYNELLTRWIEYGAFCPIFRMHGYTSQTEIWRYAAATQAAFRMYDDLRYRLLPYYYSLARMVTNSGYTIMRGLVMDFRTDANVNNITNQFMSGPAFLVNPVLTAGATTRNVYLPSGSTWYNFWTGQTSAGGQTVSARAHRDTIPVFVRSGSIIPLGPYLQYAAQKQADTIELRAYPGGSGSFTLYEDQGDNYNYETGSYATIPITYDGSCVRIGARSGSFTGMLTSRRFNVVFVRSNHGVGVPKTTVASPDTSVLYSGSLVECGTCGSGVMEDASPALRPMLHGMVFKVAKDRITFNETLTGKTKSVAVYNLGGERLAIRTVLKNVVSLRRDFGLPAGAYIVKVRVVR